MERNEGTTEFELTDITVACHVRASMLLEPVDSHVETLQTCEREGSIDSLLLRSWPERVTRSEECPHPEVIERFETFEQWADSNGLTIQPPFEVRSDTSRVTGEHRKVLVTPLICLGLYEDGRLVGVYPHSAGSETYTVEDAIATIRTGELPTPLSAGAGATGGGDACPECESRLVNGQGLFACVDCGWTGTVADDGQYVPLEEGETEEEASTVRN